ncbi:InlB B-repeat-containing protein [Butyrivibrio sp. AD3002]|uniref:InlB B-repeat-containing protein n=1 Tax=Butyrivibrio sp. AD3002 TaxID=1280670 RepID=UPI0003B6DDA2|nr:InlB B-repeat-containing protein [Butyrivibrio sp. AD3002]
MKSFKKLLILSAVVGLFGMARIPAHATTYDSGSNTYPLEIGAGDEITAGTYTGEIHLNAGGIISGGTFNGNVTVYGDDLYTATISGGTFNGEVRLNEYATVTNGTFNDHVMLGVGNISGGSFSNLQVMYSTPSFNMASQVTGCTITGQISVLSPNGYTVKPVISGITATSSATFLDVSALPESDWAGIFTAASDQHKTVTLSINPLRTMALQNVRAGRFDKINLKFDPNGGSGNMADGFAYKYGSSGLPNNTFTKSGATFKGWSTKKYGAPAYTNEAIVSGTNLGNVGETTTLYAIWSDTPENEPSANEAPGNESGQKKSDKAEPQNNEQAQNSKDTPAETGLKPGEETADKSGTKVKASSDGNAVTVTGTKNKKTVKIGKTVTIGDNKYPVTALGKKAVTGKRVKNVTIDAKNLTSVDKNAFSGAKNLKNVTIKGVKKGSKIAKKIEKAARKANKNVKIIYK